MENNPIEVMFEEHTLISSAESIIRKLDGLWKVDSEKFEEGLGNLIVFFREFADGIHHQKEETVLFPAVKNHPDFTLDELLDELEQHHEQFREYSQEIIEYLTEKNYQEAYKIMVNYFEDLLDHIAAENEELFIMAENLLDPSELETIYFKFKDIDLEQGEAKRAKLISLLKSTEELIV